MALSTWVAPAGAHEFKLDAVINAFVRIEAGRAHLVVRAPLYLFKGAKFPVRGAEIDVDRSAAAVSRAVEGLARDLTLLENGQPLAPSVATGRLALPSDRSFVDYASAVSHVATPIEPGTGIFIDQGYVDAHLTFPINSPHSTFALRSTAAPELGPALKVTVRFEPADGDPRTMVIDAQSGPVALNPGRVQAAAGFVRLGIAHILTGTDHLLFLLCLLIPLRGVRQVLTVVTGFTLAHSFTLIGSAFHLAPGGPWFPPFVEMAIALSIVYMALENIIGVDFRRRLLLTMLFGLVHGFGFSYGLSEQLQFAGTHLLVSLFAFNLGIEIGQLVVLAAMLPAYALLTRYVLPGRAGTIIVAALIAHTGWHWMGERWETLSRLPLPDPTASDAVVLLLWIAGLALAGIAIAALAGRLRLTGNAGALIA
jgi:hypothetical protein